MAEIVLDGRALVLSDLAECTWEVSIGPNDASGVYKDEIARIRATPEFQQSEGDLDFMRTKILDLEAEADRLKAEAQALRSEIGDEYFNLRRDVGAVFEAQHGPAFPRQDFTFVVNHDLDQELRRINASGDLDVVELDDLECTIDMLLDPCPPPWLGIQRRSIATHHHRDGGISSWQSSSVNRMHATTEARPTETLALPRPDLESYPAMPRVSHRASTRRTWVGCQCALPCSPEMPRGDGTPRSTNSRAMPPSETMPFDLMSSISV